MVFLAGDNKLKARPGDKWWLLAVAATLGVALVAGLKVAFRLRRGI